MPARSVPLQRDPALAARQAKKAVRGVLWGVGCTVLLSILVPGIILWVVFSKTTEAVEGIGDGAGVQIPNLPNIGVGTQSEEPLECNGGSVVRTNATVAVTAGPAVIVRNGCQLRLVNTTVRGEAGIRVEGDGEVTMVNGTIDADGTAVFASGTASLTLTNVEVSGERGVATEDSARVQLVNGGIRATKHAIEARGSSTVHAQNADVLGSVESDPTASVRY